MQKIKSREKIQFFFHRSLKRGAEAEENQVEKTNPNNNITHLQETNIKIELNWYKTTTFRPN